MEEAEDLVALLGGDVAARVRQRRRERHVDRDRVAVAKGNRRHQLERGRPGVAERDDTVETDLVQVRRLELDASASAREASAHLEHDLDAAVDDLVGRLADLLGRALDATEAGLDELLAVLLQQPPGANVADRADLDELRKAVAD